MMDKRLANALKKALNEKSISQGSFDAVTTWLENQEYAPFQLEIIDLIAHADWATLDDSFRTTIPFGTGGRRGPRGVGPNRINERTIGESAQGLANHISKISDQAKQKGVAIAYDTRIKSAEFAQLTAEILAGNGIKAYLFDGPRSTPELSFAVRFLKAQAGVVISASHNPPTDNGFKVYNDHGGQIVQPEDALILKEVNGVAELTRKPLDEAQSEKLVEMIGEVIDKAYWSALASIPMRPTRTAKIVYSPLHGTGSTNVLPALKKTGYGVSVVRKQMPFDGLFTFCPRNIPNPEVHDTLNASIEQAKQESADLVIVSDPDADRIGVAAPDRERNWQTFTGNQIGAIAVEYIGRTSKESKKLPKHGVVIETVVTSRLIGDIARSYDFGVIDDLLVGFKYIADAVDHFAKNDTLVFAAEESLGYLVNPEVRDKDAAHGALIMAECASWLKDQSKMLPDFLDEIHGKYGYYKEILHTISYPGSKGVETMKDIMEQLRNYHPKTIAGLSVVDVSDRSVGPPPNDNLLIFILSKDRRNRIAARPSGTEPKIKFYISSYEQGGKDEAMEDIKKRVDDQAAQFVEYVKGLGEKGTL